MSGHDTILHATTVCLGGAGLLIRGASGSGKSGLALKLMALGAVLVADDRTRIRRGAGCIMADAPAAIRGRIEARGVGILNAPVAGPVPVVLVVDMDVAETERLPPRRWVELLQIPLPLVRKIDTDYFPSALCLYLRHGRYA